MFLNCIHLNFDDTFMVLYYFRNNNEVDKNYFLYLKIEERMQKDKRIKTLSAEELCKM